jgi:hypothetical protein
VGETPLLPPAGTSGSALPNERVYILTLQIYSSGTLPETFARVISVW